jgi:16S rRNA (guanine966-N2)-methyltransferase
LRIIAGKFRGRRLKTPPSLDTRPTSDRLRETLFNVIAPLVPGSRFLDLCAGSGAVGLEALSRGAAHATLVDRSRKMSELIQANLDLCRITDTEADVVTFDALEFLHQAMRRKLKTWEIVFFDPPYASDYGPLLELFGAQSPVLLAPDGILVVEHHHKTELADEIGNLIRARILKQGESSLSFYSAFTALLRPNAKLVVDTSMTK